MVTAQLPSLIKLTRQPYRSTIPRFQEMIGSFPSTMELAGFNGLVLAPAFAAGELLSLGDLS